MLFRWLYGPCYGRTRAVLILFVSSISVISASVQNCTTQPSIPCRLLVGKTACDSFNIGNTSGLWPGNVSDFKPDIFMYQDDKENSTRPGIRFTWTPPHDASIRELKGFQINILFLTGDLNKGRTQCNIMDLSTVDWPTDPHILIDYMKTKFTLEKMGFPGGVSYYAELYSLPRSPHSIDLYSHAYFTTPSVIGGALLPHQWVAGILVNPVPCVGVIEASFILAPEKFKFHRYTVRLKYGSNRKTIYSYAVTARSSAVTQMSPTISFHNVSEGRYYITVDPYEYGEDNKTCLCPIHISLNCYCMRTALPHFNFSKEGCPTPAPAPSHTTTIVDNEHSDLAKILAPILGCLAAFGLLIVAYLCWRKRRADPRTDTPCTVTSDKAKQVVNGGPYIIDNKTNNEDDDRLPLITAKSVYLLSAHDNPAHQRVIRCLAEYLNKHCKCSVLFPSWYLKEIQEVGPISWVLSKVEEASFIIIVNSEAAFRLVEAHKNKQIYRQIDESPMGDMFTPAYTKIVTNFYKDCSYKKFIMTHFDYTARSYILKDVSAGYIYELMKHFKELLGHIHGVDPSHRRLAEINLSWDKHDNTVEGVQLLAAIKAAQEYVKEKPKSFSEHFYEVMACAPPTPLRTISHESDRRYDSGLGSTPIDSLEKETQDSIRQNCIDNLRTVKLGDSGDEEIDADFKYIPPDTDSIDSSSNVPSDTESDGSFIPPADLYSVATDVEKQTTKCPKNKDQQNSRSYAGNIANGVIIPGYHTKKKKVPTATLR